MVVVLFLLLALAILGCGGGDEDDATTAAPTTPSASTEPNSNGPKSDRHRSTGAGSGKSADRAGASGSGPAEPGSSHSAPEGSQPPKERGKPRTEEGHPVGTVPSGGGPAADERAVVRTIRAYLVAIARGDGVQACAQLTPEGRRAVERQVARAAPETKGSPCETAIELYQSSYRAATGGVRVTNVSVAGDRAEAVALRQPASLVKQGRTWLIAKYAN